MYTQHSVVPYSQSVQQYLAAVLFVVTPPASEAEIRRADVADAEHRGERYRSRSGSRSRVPRGQGLDDGVEQGRVRGNHELVVDLPSVGFSSGEFSFVQV